MIRVLADTSIWADHFRALNPDMSEHLVGDVLMMHPMVIGELAMGNLRSRANVLKRLTRMDEVVCASDREVLAFVERHALHGLGIGWIDAHLLVATLLTPGCALWTHDRRLNATAERFGRAAQMHH